jgi:hypothetical protein
VSRAGSIALVAALLVATGAAFAATERLKLTQSPILRTSVENKVFSPVCDCSTDVAIVRFRLRKADRLDVEIVQGSTLVRSVVRNTPYAGSVEIVWDGRTDSGTVADEGTYQARVRLLRQRRTITLPNPIRVDVTPPVVEGFAVAPRTFSPDGDGRRETVVARYAISEPAQVGLLVDGRRQVLKRGQKPTGEIRWFGLVDGETVAAGVYRLSVVATDVAGNVGQRSREVPVLARFVALGRRRIETVPGGRIAVLVVSDARRVTWKLGARSGEARPGTLRLTAPLRPGRYPLVVTANGHAARAVVVVRAPGAGG